MDNEKIIIKNSQITFMGLIFSLLLVIGLFTGMYLWIDMNASEQGVSIDSKYNTTYNAYQDATDSIQDNLNDMDSAARNIREADSTYQVAWNGLKGLGSLLTLPLSAIDSGQTVYDASATQIDGIIPDYYSLIIRILVIFFILLVVIAVMKGDNNLI